MKIAAWGSRVLKLAVAALALVFISCVALADYFTGYETAISLLYIAAIVLTAWLSWQYAAFIITILSGTSDVLITYLFTGHCQAVNILNAAIQTVFFLVFTWALIALKDSRERLKRLSREDPLTELVNGRYFFQIGDAEAQRSLRYRHPFSVVYIDIDNFKAVNDTLGHSAGNRLLHEIGSVVKGAIRKTDTMGRLGGDEFAILLPETGVDAAKTAAARIQASLLNISMQKTGPVTFSIGVVTNDGRPCAFDDIIKAADRLMYEAKRGGKNTVRAGTFG